MTNKTKGLTKIVNACNKLGVNYEISHTEYVFGEEYFQNYAIKINNHYFIAHKGGIVVDKVNRAYGEGQFFCKNQKLALCYIFGYNNVLPNNYIVVDLDDATGEILGYTVDESNVPCGTFEETQERNGIEVASVPCGTIQEDETNEVVPCGTFEGVNVMKYNFSKILKYVDNNGYEIKKLNFDDYGFDVPSAYIEFINHDLKLEIIIEAVGNRLTGGVYSLDGYEKSGRITTKTQKAMIEQIEKVYQEVLEDRKEKAFQEQMKQEKQQNSLNVPCGTFEESQVNHYYNEGQKLAYEVGYNKLDEIVFYMIDQQFYYELGGRNGWNPKEDYARLKGYNMALNDEKIKKETQNIQYVPTFDQLEF